MTSLAQSLKTISVENNELEFEMTLEGSAFTKFKLRENDINPLNWQLPYHRLPHTNTGSYPFQGHFICLGTWGYPTKGEIEAGLKFYGEVNTRQWQVESELKRESTIQSVTTSCLNTMEKLDIVRTVTMFDEVRLIRVKEKITNRLPIGRPYNILQHATFGGDFLTNKTLIHTNAGKGFYQNGEKQRETFANIEENSYNWPNAQLPAGKVNLTDTQFKETYVSSHIFPVNEKRGWATIANKDKGILVGYVWNLKDYPWLNVWYQFEEGELKGRAIEFATCGMWNSFEYMMSNNTRFFGQNSFEFIDAGETNEKLYTMFILPIDSGFSEVTSISLEDNVVCITLNNEGKEQIQNLKF